MKKTDAVKRTVAVSDGSERENYLLKLIFSSCGQGTFQVVPENAVQGTDVILSPDSRRRPDPLRFPVWVTRYPETGGIDRRGYRRIVTYSDQYREADFTAQNIRSLPNGVTAFEIVGVGIIGRVRLQTSDQSAVEPAIAAAAAAMAAGVPFADALEALNRFGKSARQTVGGK